MHFSSEITLLMFIAKCSCGDKSRFIALNRGEIRDVPMDFASWLHTRVQITPIGCPRASLLESMTCDRIFFFLSTWTRNEVYERFFGIYTIYRQQFLKATAKFLSLVRRHFEIFGASKFRAFLELGKYSWKFRFVFQFWKICFWIYFLRKRLVYQMILSVFFFQIRRKFRNVSCFFDFFKNLQLKQPN